MYLGQSMISPHTMFDYQQTLHYRSCWSDKKPQLYLICRWLLSNVQCSLYLPSWSISCLKFNTCHCANIKLLKGDWNTSQEIVRYNIWASSKQCYTQLRHTDSNILRISRVTNISRAVKTKIIFPVHITVVLRNGNGEGLTPFMLPPLPHQQ